MRINFLFPSIALIFTATLLLAGCGQNAAFVAPALKSSIAEASISQQAAESLIEPSITGTERTYLIQHIMTSRSPLLREVVENREAYKSVSIVVILGDEGRIYANRPALHNAIERLVPEGNSKRTYRNKNGSEVAVPAQLSRNEVFGGYSARRPMWYQVAAKDEKNGPYRRIYTEPNTFYNSTYADPFGPGEWANVTVPCNAGTYPAGKDTGYVYLGGWGNSSTGYPIDAGLFHRLQQTMGATDNYGMFFNIDGQFFMTNNNAYPLQTSGNWVYAFPCNATIHLFFYASDDGNSDDVKFNLEASGAGAYSSVSYVDTSHEAFNEGWDVVNHCPYCIFKRMTSIAQSPENLADGAKFGPITWAAATITCSGGAGCDESPNTAGMYVNSNWAPPIIGGCLEFPQWEPNGLTPAFPEDCSSSPPGTAIQVSWADTANEIDGISLSSPPQTVVQSKGLATPTPAPTSTPEKTPPPCLRQPCPQ